MKKLVKKDENGRLTEVDLKALHREASILRGYILQAEPSEEKKFSYNIKLLSLVDKALNKALKFPHMEAPYNLNLIMRGLEPDLPDAIQDIYFQFINRIQGAPDLSSASVATYGRYIPGATEVINNGVRYEWVEFED